MALPTLSKTGVSSVEITIGSTFPSREPLAMNQFTGISDNNTVRVASLGSPRRTLEVKFEQLTENDVSALEGFFSNPAVNWGLYSFVYTDEDENAWTVRYLSPMFVPERVSDDNYSLNLVFTVVSE